MANDRLHNTVEALQGGSRGSSPRLKHFGYGQTVNVDEDEMLRALEIASALFALLSEVAIRAIRGSESAVLASFVGDLRRVFTDLSPAAFTKVGRNQPCPCGSGKKFKDCHGR
jgi:uncharacterized protein YchJ